MPISERLQIAALGAFMACWIGPVILPLATTIDGILPLLPLYAVAGGALAWLFGR